MPKSDSRGRAFEYICIQSLRDEISTLRSVSIVENDSYQQDKKEWERLNSDLKEVMEQEAKAFIPTLTELEPMIEEDSDTLILKLQADKEGIEGDVRDILLIREQTNWVIGISVKHNHFAVKHSRLSGVLDFGEKWYGVPCSETYWEAVKPIFEPLAKKRRKGKWSSLPNKEKTIYVPLLNAFIDEVNRAYKKDKSIPSKMVEYLLGKYDFYKVIGLDSRRQTSLMCFNLRGTLNKKSQKRKPNKKIPVSLLPKRIVSLAFKPNSCNTVELYMDNGWQFSFRIHNASTMIETSLKFDIRIIGMPTTIMTINCSFRK